MALKSLNDYSIIIPYPAQVAGGSLFVEPSLKQESK